MAAHFTVGRVADELAGGRVEAGPVWQLPEVVMWGEAFGRVAVVVGLATAHGVTGRIVGRESVAGRDVAEAQDEIMRSSSRNVRGVRSGGGRW